MAEEYAYELEITQELEYLVGVYVRENYSDTADCLLEAFHSKKEKNRKESEDIDIGM